MYIITTRSVQLAAYFEICKSSQLSHQDKHLRTAKIIKLQLEVSNFNFIKFSTVLTWYSKFQKKRRMQQHKTGKVQHKSSLKCSLNVGKTWSRVEFFIYFCNLLKVYLLFVFRTNYYEFPCLYCNTN